MYIGDVSNHHPFFNEKNLSKLKIKCKINLLYIQIKAEMFAVFVITGISNQKFKVVQTASRNRAPNIIYICNLLKINFVNNKNSLKNTPTCKYVRHIHPCSFKKCVNVM
jgi:hypothetical protein